MRHMNGKTKMLVMGMLQGVGMTTNVVLLLVKGQLGRSGLFAVLLLIVLASLTGFQLGMQKRVRIERFKLWMMGYEEGQEAGKKTIEINCLHMVRPEHGQGR